jgi:uncharacterized protein
MPGAARFRSQGVSLREGSGGSGRRETVLSDLRVISKAVPTGGVTERPTPEPTQRLAPQARSLFALEVLGGALPFLAVAIALGVIFLDQAPAIAVGVLAVALTVAAAIVIPQVRLARFRYEVREDEIDLLRGILVQTRTLVPMVRVQHVDMRRTVVSQSFGLASVVFHTAAGSNEIPALREGDAAAIRDRIADLARTPEVL